jgi:glycosyltransferase involved in cell wall biosynthesis
MKIIELTNEFSMGNGISDVIRTVSDGLSKTYDVEIWYNYYLRALPKTKAKLIKKNYEKMFRDLMSIKEKTILHTYFGRTFFIGTVAKIFNKNIVHIHTEGINPPISASGGTKSAYYFIEALHRVSYLFGFGVNKAIGISKYACREIKRQGVNNKKIKLIYLGVDLKKKKKFNKPRSLVNFGALSRFSRSKNLNFLFEKYDNFPRKSKLFVAGAIDLRDKKTYEECEMIAKEKGITLIKNLPRKEFPQFYSKFDVFLFPSKWEGFGLPMLEAMAHGKPVICFNRYAMPEIVRNNYNGFVVNTEKEFFEKMEFLNKNPKVILRLSENALKTLDYFSKEKMIEGYKKIINTL